MAGKREAGGLFLADPYKWSDMEPPKKKDPNKRANNASLLVVINGVITSITLQMVISPVSEV